MGIYIDTGNMGFASSRKGIYVDKSGLIPVVNETINSERRYSCVSRCRRFGKSMAAKMLAAYYDRSCDSRQLFAGLQAEKDPSFEEHLNKYPVIFFAMTDFTTRFKDASIMGRVQKEIIKDVHCTYPEVPVEEDDDLMAYLIRIANTTGEKFIFILDEWDAVLRERPAYTDDFVNWLRRMFKGASTDRVFAAVYMTGILPIKKYKTESALNNFQEYSVVKPGIMARYFGFTKKEVKQLAEDTGMSFDELEKWYDGYQIGDEPSMFNPNSVVAALYEKWCTCYWGRTGAYDSVLEYIQRNYDGLKDSVIRMLTGGKVSVNTSLFQNDMTDVNGRDDVFTVLIHLGYLSYDRQTQQCFVPNYEVSIELKNAVKETGWAGVSQALQQSQQLLEDTIAGNAAAVARAVDTAHDENTSILSYNDENSLACVLSIAYYSARGDYHIHREYPTGKGYADLVMIPRKNVSKPALVIELKSNRSARAAISQIRRKEYPEKIAEYTGQMLLVGINYDKKKKKHTCRIEKWEKTEGLDGSNSDLGQT